MLINNAAFRFCIASHQTSLLAAALGEMTRSAGSVTVRGSVAYFSQQSWVLSATVKENIVFGHAFGLFLSSSSRLYPQSQTSSG
jgi:hypothetical protein